MSEMVIKVENLVKKYTLGTIGVGTLQGDLQSWWARIHGKDDPNVRIGRKSYKKNETFMALNGINFDVYRGDTLGIIGSNGAGKSTTLKILSRVTAPTKGFVKIKGKISSMLEVGTGFHNELTGRENIFLNGAILGMNNYEIKNKLDEIIEFSECKQFIDTPVKRYSSGMYVKLAFAVAAHLDCDILVMDEVLAVGDIKFQQKCLGKMSDVANREGKTVLYVSHNMNTIRQLCNRCLLLDKGKVFYDGNVDEAIQLYLNSEEVRSVFYDLSNSKRPYYEMGQKLRILSISYINTKTPIFKNNEVIRFNIKFICHSKIDNISIRLDLHYINGVNIGAAESDNIENYIPNGVNSMNFLFDIGNLPDGKYYFEIDVFERNDFRKHLSLDHPLTHIYFEVLDTKMTKIIWDHRYMGHVRLKDLVKY